MLFLSEFWRIALLVSRSRTRNKSTSLSSAEREEVRASVPQRRGFLYIISAVAAASLPPPTFDKCPQTTSRKRRESKMARDCAQKEKQEKYVQVYIECGLGKVPPDRVHKYCACDEYQMVGNRIPYVRAPRRSLFAIKGLDLD